MQTVWSFGAVFLGGGLGSAFRYAVGRASEGIVGPGFPSATLVVNLAGCFLMGILGGWISFRDWGLDHSTRLFLATGMLGGFTTFSAFALDAVALWERGHVVSAAVYVLSSVVGSIAGLVLGLYLVRQWAS